MYFKFNSLVQLLLSLSGKPFSCFERCKDVGCVLIQFKMPNFLSVHSKFSHCHLLDKCRTVFYFNTPLIWGDLLEIHHLRITGGGKSSMNVKVSCYFRVDGYLLELRLQLPCIWGWKMILKNGLI